MMRRFPEMALIPALLLGACSPFSPRPDPTVFLVLAPLSASAAASAPAPALATTTVGVGPVSLPSYLQRPQLVARLDETQLRVHEHARWSAPLGTLFSEAVAEHLMASLSPRAVAVYPWSSSDRPTVSVRIAVQRFETVADSAVLRARWELVDRAGGPLGAPRTSEHRTAAALDPAGAPEALSRLVGMLAGEIAAALRAAR